MAERGAFDGVDAAMMVHPAGADLLGDGRHRHPAAARSSYHGEAAHAAAVPAPGPQRPRRRRARLHERRRAAPAHPARRADPRHLHRRPATSRTSCPTTPRADWYVRSPTLPALEPLKERVLACLRGGRRRRRLRDGASTGATPRTPTCSTTGHGRAATAPTPPALGRIVGRRRRRRRVVGSTDMGNVSYLVPSIHPMIKVAPPDVSIHSPEFAGYAGGPDGDRAVLDGAKAHGHDGRRPVARPDVSSDWPGRVGAGGRAPASAGRQPGRRP